MNKRSALRSAAIYCALLVATSQPVSTQRTSVPVKPSGAGGDALPSRAAANSSSPQQPKPTPDPREEIMPEIKAPKNVKVETIKGENQPDIQPYGVISPKKIVKTGRHSKKLVKDERKFSAALIEQLKIKEAKKRQIEERQKAKPEKREGATGVAPRASFALDGGGGDPPDNTVAVSKNGFIVAADNNQIGFYREDGTELNTYSYPDFFNDLEDDTEGLGTTDPKVIYDPEEDRFIFLIQYKSITQIGLAFSTAEDPMEDWNFYLRSTASDGDLWFDYPSLSVNYHEVFLTGNLFNDDGDFAGNVIMGIDKDDGYARRGLTWRRWRDTTRPNNPFALADSIIAVPASRSRMYGPGTLFLSTISPGGGDVFLFKVTDHIFNDPDLLKYTIDIKDYEVPASAAQPDTDERLDIGDCRIKSAYYQHGKVYFVFTKDDGHAFGGISYNRINLDGLYVKSWFFHDDQNSDYSYAALCNRKSNETYSYAVLVYLRSGKHTFPQIRSRLFYANMKPVRRSSTIMSGTSFRNDTNDNPGRWGDYIGIQRKYGTKKAWMTGHTATPDNVWQTHLISIDLP